MADIPIEQAIYGNAGSGGYRFLARSPGFRDEWLHEAELLCTGFGERPAGVACPDCVFAQPLGPDHVAVVQVADQGSDDAGRPGALGFHLLVLPRKEYSDLIGDPFVIADRYPPSWEARDEVPTLSWPAEPLPGRTVAEVQRVLKEGDSPSLLGGAQALVDGGRLIFERPAPATPLLRDLWMLLPTSTRNRLWPASFAFDNALGFDVLVVPRLDITARDGYLTEEQAGDYPQGRYELNLQIAAEAGDQHALDALFARRNSAQTLKLALMLVVVVGILAVVMNILNHAGGPSPRGTRPAGVQTTAPLAARYPRMKDADRIKVAEGLKELARELDMPLPSARPTIEQLLDALDSKLGTPDPSRDPGPLRRQGDTERQLRVLLWKHHVAGFDDPAYNPVELVERLRQKVAPAKRMP
jgi:hypothetical protein